MSEIAALKKNINEALEKVVREHRLRVENLTRSQFIEALKQALASGDFQRHVVAGSSYSQWRQAVTYIPFRHSQYLQQRIIELEAEIVQLLKAAAERL